MGLEKFHFYLTDLEYSTWNLTTYPATLVERLQYAFLAHNRVIMSHQWTSRHASLHMSAAPRPREWISSSYPPTMALRLCGISVDLVGQLQ